MIKKTILIVLIAIFFSVPSKIGYGKGAIKGILEIIYRSCECGMNNCHEYRCFAPFHIRGHMITGDFERKEISENSDDLNIIPLAPTHNDKQIIKYSYQCPPVDDDCPPPRVSGLLIVHKVSGKVITVKGKKMLHFVVRLSIPICSMITCGYENDCSMAAWDDDFLAPFQDNFQTKRGENIQFQYIVNLRSGKE